VTPNSKWHQRFRAPKGCSTLKSRTRWRRRSHSATFEPATDSSRRELAKEFGVNRLTVRQALADLQLRKLILRRTGRNGGTFIAEPVIEYDLTTFAGFPNRPAVSVTSPARGCCELNASKPMRRRPRRCSCPKVRGLRNRSLALRQRPPGAARALEFPAERFAACSVSRSTDRFTNSSSAATTPGRCARSSESHRRRECAHRAPTGRHPGHAATARRT